jgi:hypothetical protein
MGIAKAPRTVRPAIIWPRDVEARYGISCPTRLRWEKAGRLPKRDVYLAGQPMGWKPETLDAADAGPIAGVA